MADLHKWVETWRERGVSVAPMAVFYDANKENMKKQPKLSGFLTEKQDHLIQDDDVAYCVITGHGLIALDFDDQHWVNKALERYGKMTYCVASPNGLHVYFRTPKDFFNQDLRKEHGFEVKSLGQSITGPGSLQDPNKPDSTYDELGSWEMLADLPADLEAVMKERDVALELARKDLKVSNDASIRMPRTDWKVDSGNRNNFLTKLIMPKLVNAGLRQSDVEMVLNIHNQYYCQPPFNADEMKEIYQSAISFRDDKAYNKRQNRTWIPTLQGDSNEDKYVRALKAMGIELRHNIRSDLVETKEGQAKEWTPRKSYTDGDFRGRVRNRVLTDLIFNPNREKEKIKEKRLKVEVSQWNEVIDILKRQHSVDPFLVDFLKRKPMEIAQQMEKDQVDPADLLIWRAPEEVFCLDGCDQYPKTDPELAKWMFASPLFGATNRAFNPGAKHDQMVILIGPERSGKSSIIEWLLPPVDGWYNPNMDFSAPRQKIIESVCQSVIVEAAEMPGMNQEVREACKALLSAGADIIRLAYRKDAVVMKRRCAIMGSSNKNNVLPRDFFGNRRYLPTVCRAHKERGHADCKAWLYENQPRLWGEAIYWTQMLNRNSELPPELWESQLEHTRQHSGIGDDRQKMKEVLEDIAATADESVYLRAEEILFRCGWQDPSLGQKKLLANVAKEIGLMPPRPRNLGKIGTHRVYEIVPQQSGLGV